MIRAAIAIPAAVVLSLLAGTRVETDDAQSTRAAGEEGRPEIHLLRPDPFPAGVPEVLQILGAGFAEGARVEVTVNLNAGSTRLPEYGPRIFAAERFDDELLEVVFDRGFYPVPGARDVVVIASDGTRSRPRTLHIRSKEATP